MLVGRYWLIVSLLLGGTQNQEVKSYELKRVKTRLPHSLDLNSVILVHHQLMDSIQNPTFKIHHYLFTHSQLPFVL